MERRSWTPEQDEALKQLYEKRGIKKWAQISRLLSLQYQIQNRSGKQCRQRYHNHLDTSIKRDKWSEEQQLLLVQMHNKSGNKWADISRVIKGRSQNCVKNQFYSILRRGLRQINATIRKRLKRHKQFPINILYNLVQRCEKSYRHLPIDPKTQKALDFKKLIIRIGLNEIQLNVFNQQKLKQIIQQIKSLSKSNERKNKLKSKKQKQQSQESQMNSSQYMDNYPIKQVPLKKHQSSLQVISVDSKNQRQQADIVHQMEHLPMILQQISKKQSSQISNKSVDLIGRYDGSYKQYIVSPSPRGIQWTHFDNIVQEGSLPTISPKPMLLADSPYFDQLRSNFNNWHNFYRNDV